LAIMHRFHAEKAYTTAVTLRFTADLLSRHADYPIGGMAPVLAKNLRELRVRRPLEPPGGDLFEPETRPAFKLGTRPDLSKSAFLKRHSDGSRQGGRPMRKEWQRCRQKNSSPALAG